VPSYAPCGETAKPTREPSFVAVRCSAGVAPPPPGEESGGSEEARPAAGTNKLLESATRLLPPPVFLKLPILSTFDFVRLGDARAGYAIGVLKLGRSAGGPEGAMASRCCSARASGGRCC